MSETEEQEDEQAATAGEEEIARYLHDPSPRVIRALLENRNLSEEDVLDHREQKEPPC